MHWEARVVGKSIARKERWMLVKFVKATRRFLPTALVEGEEATVSTHGEGIGEERRRV